jgi:hypothetical protein
MGLFAEPDESSIRARQGVRRTTSTAVLGSGLILSVILVATGLCLVFFAQRNEVIEPKQVRTAEINRKLPTVARGATPDITGIGKPLVRPVRLEKV